MRWVEKRVRLSCDRELVLVVVEPALVRGGDEAVHAVVEVDHELLPPPAHGGRVAAVAGGEEPAQVLIGVLTHGHRVAAARHALTLADRPRPRRPSTRAASRRRRGSARETSHMRGRAPRTRGWRPPNARRTTDSRRCVTERRRRVEVDHALRQPHAPVADARRPAQDHLLGLVAPGRPRHRRDDQLVVAEAQVGERRGDRAKAGGLGAFPSSAGLQGFRVSTPSRIVARQFGASMLTPERSLAAVRT